jgi:hypothetical protein
MTITAEILDEKIKLLEGQKEQHFAVYHQAIGALGIVQHLKTLLAEKDHMTLDELGTALGGTVEGIEPNG